MDVENKIGVGIEEFVMEIDCELDVNYVFFKNDVVCYLGKCWVWLGD